mgnify:FL=1
MEAMQARYGWQRMQASGLDVWGAHRMEATARCVAQGITPSDSRMPGCIEAGTTMLVADGRRRAQEQEAMRPPPPVWRMPPPMQFPTQPPPAEPARLRTECRFIGAPVNRMVCD